MNQDFAPHELSAERREELERLEFQMGPVRGKLAVAMDAITDSLVLVGQHGVYCQSVRQPGKPAMDLQIILQSLEQAKRLVQAAMAADKAQKA